MYTLVAADLYSDYRLAVSPVPGRHMIKFSPTLALPKERGAIWFLLWWLYLHRRVTSPATRLKSEDPSDFGYPEVDHSLKARQRFYPRRPKRALRPSSEPKPFGFSGRCNSCDSRLSPLSNDASPHRLPILSLVTTPVSTATRVWFIRVPLEQVKQKIL